MPSKYYNPRLARSAGSAQDAGYTSVSGVIDKAFEPFEEQMAIRQERLFQEKERERKQKEQYEKDSAKYYESMAGLEGQIDPGHQEDFREHLQARFAETKACMDKNIGDPVAIAKCKGGLSTEINTIANTYSSWRKSNNDRLAHEKEFGVSEVNDEKDIEMANRILNIGGEEVDYSTGKPRTYRVDENGNPIMKTDAEGNFIVDENGFGQIDYFDFEEEAKNFSLTDNSGTDVHHTLMGTIGKQIDNDIRDNTDPKIGMMMLDKSLKTVTPKNALHILSTEFKIAGVNGELNRFFRDAERNDTSTGIYFDMGDDWDYKKQKKFWDSDDEGRAAMGAVKIQGERALVELAKDQYRFAYAQTMQKKLDEINENTPGDGDNDNDNDKNKTLSSRVIDLLHDSVENQVNAAETNLLSNQEIDFDEKNNIITVKNRISDNNWEVDTTYYLNSDHGNDIEGATGDKVQGRNQWLKRLSNMYLTGTSDKVRSAKRDTDDEIELIMNKRRSITNANKFIKNPNNDDNETPERKALIKALESKYGTPDKK